MSKTAGFILHQIKSLWLTIISFFLVIIFLIIISLSNVSDFLPAFFYEISLSGSGTDQGAGVMESRVLLDKLESQNHCSSCLFLPSIHHQILDVIFPDFLRHKATGQLVTQSLLPPLSQFWDKVKIKNNFKGIAPFTERD